MIEVELGDLSVTVKAENASTAKRMFDEVWHDRLEETQESVEALRGLTMGYE